MTTSWVPALGGWLLTYLLHSTLLLGGAWLVTRRGALAAARREVLWKVALVGGLVSATAQAAVMGGSLGWSLPLPAPASSTVSSTSAAQAEPEAWTGLLGERAGAASQADMSPAAAPPVDAAPRALVSPAQVPEPTPSAPMTAPGRLDGSGAGDGGCAGLARGRWAAGSPLCHPAGAGAPPDRAAPRRRGRGVAAAAGPPPGAGPGRSRHPAYRGARPRQSHCARRG